MKWSFAKHTWLGFIRSPALTRKIIEGVIIGFFAIYTAVGLMALGYAAPSLIREFMPGANPTEIVAGAFCAYLLMDILLRYFVQKFPAMTIKPYLLLPISKSKIVRYMLVRALFSPFNLIIPVFLIPFYFAESPLNQPSGIGIGLLILAFSIVLTANYISYAITAFSGANKNWAFGALAAIVGIIYLEYSGITHFLPYIFDAGGVIISTPALWIAVIALPIAVVIWLYRAFIKEITYTNTGAETISSGYLPVKGVFSRFGKYGILMDLELRLIIRSKRARTFIIASVAFCFMPFIMGMTGKEEISIVLIAFAAFFMTGGFALNHGQLLLSWNSMHFDLLMSRGYTLKDIFTAKYYFLALVCGLTYILTLPYVFIFPEYPYVALALTLWNASFSIYGYMILASVKSERIDPNEGGMFNHSGFGISHYLIMLPLMGLPFAIYGLGWFIGGTTTALLLVGGIGILGIIFHNKLIGYCVSLFKRNRYRISNAFRTK